MSDVDVLVVGAGPVGLMAAGRLAHAGVSVRLVDKAAGLATTSRALGAHARSLEIYDQCGVLGDIAAHGTRVNAFIRHRPGGAPARLDFEFGALRTQFPYMFNIDQVIVERVLRGAAATAGVAVEWHTALEGFAQDDAGVTAELRYDDGTDARRETVRARYLWGCDGGHSVVRKTLGLPLEGDPAHTWLIADAIVHAELDRDGVHWLFPGGSTLMLFPFPDAGKWRLLDTSGDGDPDDPAQIAAQLGERLSAALGRDAIVEPPSWASKFTIQQRAVPAMHVGRCFVSGDAAHVHSPASGQGLNTGIQDAFNLAWKLAMVVRGEADPSLLDTYDAERVPIGQALLASTGQVMANTMVDTTSGGDAGDDGGADLHFMRRLIRSMSGLAIAYPDSPLTDPDAGETPAPAPGERLTRITAEEAQSPGWMALRAALRSPGWKLLEFPGDSSAHPADLPGWIERVPIAAPRGDRMARGVWDPDGCVRDTLGGAGGSWILVRPDGYVSARGSGAEALAAAVDRLTAVVVGADRPAAVGGRETMRA